MKKTITLLAAAMILMIAEVHASRLFLTTGYFRSTTYISGQQHFSHNGVFQINKLSPGKHFVRVTQQNHTTRGNTQRRHNRGLVFKGNIIIPQQSDVYARVSPRGHLIIDRTIPHRRNTRRTITNPQRGCGVNYSKHSRGHTSRRKARAPELRGQANNNFNTALTTIKQASFQSQKTLIAKQYLRNNDVTSRQVLHMIRAFTFESSKLEIAKKAYRSTVDPQNYFLVNQGFDFSSSSRALDRFIR
ncbi:DUF4476 domain-containing protein [Bacteroidia bacterium]|jgi:hypothetical protein|nr:DUF4476 domain-containing protein [Bacteroidia bacterium]